jgi:ABC-2 type transport system permease protein
VHFWFLALFIPPLLTMRLLSEEFRMGTIETLMTAPSTDVSVVTGKYLAALGYTILLWLPTVGFFLTAQAHGATFDWGIVAAGYLGAILIFALFLAIGVFASALTETPILSALLTVVLELFFFFVMMLPNFVRTGFLGDAAKAIGDRYSIYQILSDSLLKGVVDTMHLVFFASLTWLFLFLATRSLEFRRWR